MICKDDVYMFLMNEHPYYFEQSIFFGDGNGRENAIGLFTENKYNDDRHLISRLTFDELCGLKEAVDKIFENLLPRYSAKPDNVRWLLKGYPWLKEKADINPLFGSGEKQEEE